MDLQSDYERLVRAKLIDPDDNVIRAAPKRPSRPKLSAARAALASGPLASDIVSEERG